MQKERLIRLGRESLAIGAGIALGAIGGMVGVRLMTEALTPADYGILALAMTGTTLMQRVVFAGPVSAIVRFFSQSIEQNDYISFSSAVKKDFIQRVGYSLLILLVVIAILWGTGQREWILLAILSLLFADSQTANALVNGIQNAARQRIVVAFHKAIASWLRFFIAIALIRSLGLPTSTVAMNGYLIAGLLVIGSQSLFYRYRFRTFIDRSDPLSTDSKRDWFSKIRTFSYPFTLWGIPLWLQVASSRWFLQFFSGSAEIGYFSALYQLGNYPIMLFVTAMMEFIRPIVFAKVGSSTNVDRIKRVHKVMVWLVAGYIGFVLVAVGFGYMFHRSIFNLLVAEQYQHVSYLLCWMVLGAGFENGTQIVSMFLMNRERVNKLMPPRLLSAGMGVIANAVGAYYFGLTGIVAASVFYGIVSMILIVIATIREEKRIEIQWNKDHHA